MNTAPCHCEAQTTRPGVNERPRYYSRQLITPDDMTLEQDYFRTKLRRHNRFLHGWGVVCGAVVEVKEDKDKKTLPWKIIVTAGYILGPFGDEIYVEKDQCLDVRKNCASAQPPPTYDDPDCVEAQQPAPTDEPRYVAIRYVENKTHLVRVPLGGCGCEESACEYSRFSDGYEICFLDECPDSHKDEERDVEADGSRASEAGAEGNTPACPECPTEPWVVLGEFTVDEDGKVTVQDGDCRRLLTRPAGKLTRVGGGDVVKSGPVAGGPKEEPPVTSPPTPAEPAPEPPAPEPPIPQ